MAVACGRDAPRDRRPGLSRAGLGAAAVPVAGSGWDGGAGLALVVRTGDDEQLLIMPDSIATFPPGVWSAAAEPKGGVALYGRAGMLGRATVDRSAEQNPPFGGTCAGWHVVRLGTSSGADVRPTWSVGFVMSPGAKPPAALVLDSLGVLARGDSALLAASLARLASALPDTAAPAGASPAGPVNRTAARLTGDFASGPTVEELRQALRGVPFRVRAAHRFVPAPGRQAVIAVLTRTLNTEATPFAQRILLLAERPTGGQWETTFSQSVAGREERLPSIDVLAALALGAGDATRATLVLGREADNGDTAFLIERAATGRWRVRWRSATCGPDRGAIPRRHAS